MCILHVINRILISVSAQHIDIHHHRRIYRITNECVSRRINAHFLHKFFQRDDGAGALRKLYLLPAFHDLYQLANKDINVVFGVITSTGSRCFEALDISMMICPQHIDTDIKSAFSLVDVISSIRCKVCELTICLNNDAVFIIAKICRAKPHCAIYFKDMSLRAQFINAMFNRARFM